MVSNKRHIKKRLLRTRFKKIISNAIILFLSLIVIFFTFSMINRLLFNNGVDARIPNLNTLIAQSNYEKQTGHKIQVEIWNGCGIPKLASIYTEYLRSEGIDVLDSKNADNFNYTETKILHHRGEIERALELADIMAIDEKKIIKDYNEDLFFDLTLILGNDYNNLPSYHDALMQKKPF
tara:strand:+ start:3038 stop:3574 length:537 start_codon:yes stop_codon:yes gene_type:complete